MEIHPVIVLIYGLAVGFLSYPVLGEVRIILKNMLKKKEK